MAAIEARFIIEIMGRPAKHVNETMRNLVEKLGTEKGVSVITYTVHEPVKVKDAKDLFTTFAEVEAGFDSLQAYFGIMFAYMPANIEIITPSSFKLSNDEVSLLGNQLINRLHLYESITKRLISERDVLVNRLKAAGVDVEAEFAKKPEATKENKEVQKKKSRKKN